ncbi:MAG: TIR domain-containing protein [Butyrivibrio sp.]|nr:TIR domain-containing protein [Butyrivibrio sp.]
MNNSFDIFISYRRKNSAVYSDFLYEKLKHLGYRVFRDVQELGAGFFDDNLMLAISGSTDVIVVLSPHSLDNCITNDDDWVRAEIRTALNAEKNVVPFITPQFSWPETLPDDIKRLRFCNGLKVEDERLSDCVEHELTRLLLSQPANDQIKHMLVSHFEPPKSAFCGRDSIIDDIHEMLTANTNVITLYGLGGSGKTELAKAYSKKYKSVYQNIIFAHFENSIIETFIDDSVFNITGIYRLLNETVKMESQEKYFARKLSYFKEIAGPETLVIIDDFSDNPDAIDDCFFELLSGTYKVIITTRANLSEYFSGIELTEALSKEDALSIFSRYYGRSVTNDPVSVEKLFECMNYHTLAIELIAKHMKVSHLSPKKMIEQLQEKGVRALSGRVSAPQISVAPNFAFEFIYSLFDLSDIDEEQKKILRALAIMPASGVKAEDFMNWSMLSDYSLIDALVDRSWISLNPESDILSIHPVIKDVIFDKIPPDSDNCKSVMDSANRIWTNMQGDIREHKWQDVIAPLRLIYLWLGYLQDEKAAFRCEVCKTLADAYYEMACYSEAYGYYASLCKPYIEEDGCIIADSYAMPLFEKKIKCLSNGFNMYHESYDLACSLLARANEIYKDDMYELVKYKEIVAYCAADIGLFEDSYRIRQEVVDICLKSPDVPDAERLYYMSALANSLIYVNKTQEAYDLRKEICDQTILLNWVQDGVIGIAYSNLAITALKLGHFEEAYNLIIDAYKMCEEVRGKDDFYTLCIKTNYMMIMGINKREDSLESGQKTYSRLKEIMGDDIDITIKAKINLILLNYIFDHQEKAHQLLVELRDTFTNALDVSQSLVECSKSLGYIIDHPNNNELNALPWQSIILMLPTIIHK